MTTAWHLLEILIQPQSIAITLFCLTLLVVIRQYLTRQPCGLPLPPSPPIDNFFLGHSIPNALYGFHVSICCFDGWYITLVHIENSKSGQRSMGPSSHCDRASRRSSWSAGYRRRSTSWRKKERIWLTGLKIFLPERHFQAGWECCWHLLASVSRRCGGEFQSVWRCSCSIV